MKINLSKYTLSSTISGSKPLTEVELEDLVDGDFNSSVTISGSFNLNLYIDLNSRYNLNSLTYYRTAASEESVSIYGRQNDEDVWTVLSTTSSGNFVSTDLENSYNKYRSFNIQHEVTTGEAEPLEIEVLTSDSGLSFGSASEGDVDEYSLSSGVEEEFVQEVWIKNSDLENRTFYSLIDPYGEITDIAISTSSSGIFYSLYDSGINIPDNFPWVNGHLDNISVGGSNTLKINSSVSGTYFSPVIDISPLSAGRLFWIANVSGTSIIDEYGVEKSHDTISIRKSNIAPTDSWSSGQLSVDGNWSVVSGSLPFESYLNNTILQDDGKNYIQFKVSFKGDTDFPELVSVGVEEPIYVDVFDYSPIYVKSDSSEKSGQASIITWFFDKRN